VPWPRRWIIGTAMIPRGEMGLIIAIALTTLLPPFVLKALYGRQAAA
jgi:hypothetical protein